MIANPFDADDAARRYASDRPDYSPHVTDIVQRLAGISKAVSCAVDIGSGTGILTTALSSMARVVVGVEPSPAMLERARSARNVEYRIGSAEDIPMPDSSCDLITVGSALHWFDRDRFLTEVSRIAKPGASLIVVDHWFAGSMQGDDRLSTWMQEKYLPTYPPPPRDRSWRPPSDIGTWRHVGWERYQHHLPYTPRQFARYLLTHSNLQAVIASGDESEEALYRWIQSDVSEFFGSLGKANLEFGGMVACHRK